MNSKYNQRIEMLYIAMHDNLYVFAKSTLKSESLAEEAVQETFYIACRKPEAVFHSPNPEGWLVNTLKYVMRKIQRERNQSRRILAEYLGKMVRDRVFEENRISLELDGYGMENREDFLLIKEMVLDGKSLLELAEERGISLNACKKRAQRAREKLRKNILD